MANFSGFTLNELRIGARPAAHYSSTMKASMTAEANRRVESVKVAMANMMAGKAPTADDRRAMREVPFSPYRA